MTTFTIHGWEIPVSDISRTPEQVQGRTERKASSNLVMSRQTDKRSWVGKTPWLDPGEAEALAALFNAKGDNWSFDNDVFSARGLSFSTVPARDSTNFKFGAYAMTAALGVTYTATWTESTYRTVLLWRRAGSGSFNHYALILDGASVTSKYKNGSATAETVTNWFTPSADGSFALLGKNDSGTDTTVQYDDVVVFPGDAPAEAITAWAAATEGWADFPYLKVSGDLVDVRGRVVTVVPALKGEAFTQGYSPTTGTFEPNLTAISFECREK